MNITTPAVRTREQSRSFPPVQFKTRGEPISIAEQLASTLIILDVFSLLNFIQGYKRGRRFRRTYWSRVRQQ